MSTAEIGQFGPEWESAVECGICGSPKLQIWGTVCERRIARCGGCGVVRLVDRVRESCLDRLYGSYYSPALPTPAELEIQLKNPTFAQRRRAIEQHAGDRERRFFEIGCGDGNFLAVMQRAGWAVCGSEFGAETVAMVAKRHGINLVTGDVTQQTPPGEPYSIVGAYHVLEHVYHPVAWLQGVRRILTPKGLLHLQVPNWAAITRLVSGTAWSSLTFPQHVYFYSPAMLQALLGRCGFRTLAIATWDPWHGPGQSSGSLGLLAKSLVTGRLPWTPELGGKEPAAKATGPAAPPRRIHRFVVRPLFQGAGHVLSRLEAAIGRGGVVDVVAVNED